MNAASPRRIALQMLLQVVQQGRSLDDIVAADWYRSLNAPARDLAFSRELAYGLCRWYFALAELLRPRLQKPLRDRDRDIEIILLLGLYQLLVLDTGRHAAVNETVQLARGQGKNWAAGLVNAVLRGAIRDRLALDPDKPEAAYPAWLVQRIRHDWGERADALLRGGNQRPPLSLRVDTRRTTVAEAIDKLAAAGVEALPHPRVATAIELPEPCEVTGLPGFAEGLLSVQDVSAQLAAGLLDCRPGQRALDACAAPGGKTLHLLQSCDELELEALDTSAPRLERLEENLRRAGQSARVTIGDASAPDEWFRGEAYDRILVDAPCSASGVLRRHPDIKLLRRESDIMPLQERQARMLDALWRLLKSGGRMLYCTCSILKEENQNQVGKFVERHPDCRVEAIEADWGVAQSPGRQILTGSDNMDGFYYAVLTRTAAP